MELERSQVIDRWRALANETKFQSSLDRLGARLPLGLIKTSVGHLQTVAAHLLPNKRSNTLISKDTIDLNVPRLEGGHDVLRGFIFRNLTEPHDKGLAARGLVHFFHGLSGSSDSSYLSRARDTALRLGYHVVLWNHRGAGDGRGLALEPYHSGRSDDLWQAVAWGRKYFHNEPSGFKHHLVGYSLSANAACLLATGTFFTSSPIENIELGLPDRILAICPPIDLSKCADRLCQGATKLYGQYFLLPLLKETKFRANLGSPIAQKALKELRLWSSLKTFDLKYTGPASYFGDANEYYRLASSGRALLESEVLVPTLILAASNDPITHGLQDFGARLQALEDQPNLVTIETRDGGHMGYLDRQAIAAGTSLALGNQRWLERFLEKALV